MEILVCVKQVPDAMEVTLDPVTRLLDRARHPAVTNPFDLYALEAAARLKETMPDVRVTALSLGKARALSALRDALALCADCAHLVSDEAFKGADLPMTAKVLADTVRLLEREDTPFDLIFTGEKTTDGGAGMLAQMLGTHLARPCITDALTVTHCAENGTFEITQETDAEDRMISLKAPCVISFTKASFQVRYPDIARILAAEQTDIPVTDAKTLYGASETPTPLNTVRRFRLRKIKKASHVISGAPELIAEKTVRLLADRGFV